MNKEIEAKLKEFISQNEPKGKQSVLLPYSDVVSLLYKKNYTHKQISDFFLTVEIHISRESVGEFIRKHIQLLISPNSLHQSDELEGKTLPSNAAITSSFNKDENESTPKDETPLRMHTMQKKRFSHDPTGEKNG